MAYYPDLSPYQYGNSTIRPDVMNVGWLDSVHNYPRGSVPLAFIDRLWILCRRRIMTMRGFHVCEFCDMAHDKVPTVQRGEEVLSLGFAEIRVFSPSDRVYAAPNLIYHYVVEHHYQPPEEFIQAVLKCPLSGSSEYESFLQQYGGEYGR
jgi:hypothetical protein